MRLPRITTGLWMAVIAAAEALFTVMCWRCCDRLFLPIVLCTMLLSLAAPIVLVVLSKEAARHATVWALRLLVPTFVVSSASLTAQGEHGFLSNSQGVQTGCFFLILACLRHTVSARSLRGPRGGKIKPEFLDDELA
jgi:predicted Kef-type K+ transport protein